MNWIVKGIPCPVVLDFVNSYFTEHLRATVSNDVKGVAK